MEFSDILIILIVVFILDCLFTKKSSFGADEPIKQPQLMYDRPPHIDQLLRMYHPPEKAPTQPSVDALKKRAMLDEVKYGIPSVYQMSSGMFPGGSIMPYSL
jgi:hypothetical protein